MRKGIVLIVLMLGWLFGPPSDVQEAKKAYEAKQYTVAVPLYEKAFEQYMAQHSKLNFNVGQCWLMQDSGQKAMSWYGKVTNAHAENSQMASWAWNQIGTIFAMGKDAPAQGQQQMSPGGQPSAAMMPQMGGGGMGQGQQVSREKLELALQAFKDALKQDNDNDIARYNYELIKRKLEQQDQNQQNQDNQDQQEQEQQQDQQQQQNQDQEQKKQPQNQENQGNQGEQGEPKDAEQMSQQEAERILAAMNANEKKFLQQMEKSKKHKTYNHDGPDW